MSDAQSGNAEDEPPEEQYPDWDDEYFEQVAGRLVYHYDLEKGYTVQGERFPMYGEMVIENKKHFLHPSIEIGNHQSYEHVFVRQNDRVTERDLDRLVELGHSIADEWIDPSEEHYSTEFTFVTVTSEIPDEIRSEVTGRDERTLLKYGYNGHYEVNLVVVSPETNDLVANDAADVEEAFQTWEPIETEETGLLGLIARRFQL